MTTAIDSSERGIVGDERFAIRIDLRGRQKEIAGGEDLQGPSQGGRGGHQAGAKGRPVHAIPAVDGQTRGAAGGGGQGGFNQPRANGGIAGHRRGRNRGGHDDRVGGIFAVFVEGHDGDGVVGGCFGVSNRTPDYADFHCGQTDSVVIFQQLVVKVTRQSRETGLAG